MLTRRAALATLALGTGAALTGCTLGDDDQGKRRRRRREADEADERDPDIALAALALAGEQAGLEALTATTSRHPGLAARLRAAAEMHRAHVGLLAEAAPDDAPPSPAPTDLSAPEITGKPFRVPAKEPAALTRLAALEQQLSVSNKRHAFSAQSGAFARLLASMAASAAQHAVVLA